MEMSGRSARRHVEVFNFSFLDILACVIGLLIFILTIVVISGGIGAAASSSGQTAALTHSEQQLDAARLRSAIAAKRRHNAESLLRSASSDVADVTLARDAVEQQIQQFNAEASELTAASVAAAGKITALRQKGSNLDADPAAGQRLAATFAETSALDRDTSQMQQKIRELGSVAPPVKKEVSFDIPRVRASSKIPIFIEIQGKRMWCVESDDYIQTPAFPGRTYTHRAGAVGVSAPDVAANKVAVPAAITERSRSDVVLTFLVRPDGYESFREIREWAWKKGYSVNWIPMRSDEVIQLVPADHSWEQ